MSRPEIYISLDIEADGPCPGVNSMLSLGAAAFDPTKGAGLAGLIAQWESNFELLPGAAQNAETMAWWATKPEAWAECRKNPQDPIFAMASFAAWVKALPGKPIAVCYPAGFDFTFVYYYLMRFNRSSPFGFSALDVKSYAMGSLGTGFAESSKRNYPKTWFDTSLKHTHKAIDDAIEQGVMFMNARASRLATLQEER